MENGTYGNSVLGDRETLGLLEAFCDEALNFLRISPDSFPQFVIGCSFDVNGKAIPLVIDYTNSRVCVFLPFFRILSSGNDSPTLYRLMGYQLARFWQRYITKRAADKFDSMDEDSIVFAYSLMVLKGIRVNSLIPMGLVIDMLRNEFDIDCELVEGMDMTNGKKQKVIRLSAVAQEKSHKYWKELYDDNLNRPLDKIVEGQLGSWSNPFANVDEAAAYILKIEQERLATDPYRQAIANEHYFYDGHIFRIPWASANVAYYTIEGAPVHCFVVNQLSTHNKFVLKPSLSNNKFLYRGQSEFYAPCKPSLFRVKKNYYVDDIIQLHELKCLLMTHPLVKLFQQGFELFHDIFRFKINFDGIAQHYYNNTAWLDLTSDMEVAKFFAVTTFNMKDDCYMKYAGEELGVLYYFDLKADSFQNNPRRAYLVDNIGKQPFMRSGNQSGFLVSVGKDADFNTYSDVRYVFFRHDSTITDRIFAQFSGGDTIMPAEILRSHWYARMSDDMNRRIISNDALSLNFADNPTDSHNKIRRELQRKGFKIKSYHPTFTEEEFDIYYDTALAAWEEFCSNVYFFSPEGALMKEHLRNLPDDPRYKWAFIR